MLGEHSRPLRLALALVVASSALGLAIFVALPIVLPVFHFPNPGGPYLIGTLTDHWVDTDHADVCSADANARRELMVQIGCPAAATKSSTSLWQSPHAPYVQNASALAKALSRLNDLPTALFGQLRHVTTHATIGAPMVHEKSNHPVLIFLQGAIGFRQMNTFQVEARVS